jgi:hypothetical protein
MRNSKNPNGDKNATASNSHPQWRDCRNSITAKVAAVAENAKFEKNKLAARKARISIISDSF